MKLSDMEGAVEAILFASGESVDAADIAAAIGEDKDTAISLAESLSIKYNAEKRGLKIIRVNDSFQMCTNRKYFDYVDRLFKQPKKKNLSKVVLEVLAIIAYKQPVTKNEIEEIRGVNSDHAVNKLVEYGLVCEKGRLQAPGRPILFGTTEDFMKLFGFSSKGDFPALSAPSVSALEEAAADIEALSHKPLNNIAPDGE